ncbi:InlB B-repeat-containing protein [Acholeplasma sp. OttesenSCG-928-E16]|nr:InlB B-repeat-containing protein [Acholeplasma sp. OttesenSCG-928-E16]
MLTFIKKIRGIVIMSIVFCAFFVTGCSNEIISFKDFTLKEDVYYKKVKNEISQYDISLGIEINKGYTYSIYDENEDEVALSVLNLAEGENLFTLNVLKKDKLINTYSLNIYRNKLFTVMFNSNCSTPVNNQYVEEGNKAIEPGEELTKEGNKFYKWDHNFDEEITSDMTIEAIWNPNVYTITYDPDGGDITSSNLKVVFGENYTLEEPTKEGFEFLGWLYDDKPLTGKTWNIAQDVTLTASWIVVEKTFDIIYDLVGGDGPNLDASFSNRQTLVLRTPYKKGYKFVGWYKNEDYSGDRIYEIPKGTQENQSFYAKWEVFQLDSATISFVGDSITTFYSLGSVYNSYYTGNNQFYYPRYSATVKSVTDTWWYQVIDGTKTTLLINESLSGSTVYNNGNSASSTPAMNDIRMNHLNGGDIVVVFMGTNDVVSNYTASQFETAYLTMLKKIKANCKDAFIFCCNLGYSNYHLNQPTNHGNYSEERRLLFNEKIANAANLNDAILIDFSSVQTTATWSTYLGDNLHPNATGMKALANKAIETIKNYLVASID